MELMPRKQIIRGTHKEPLCQTCKKPVVKYYDGDERKWYIFCVNKECVKCRFNKN